MISKTLPKVYQMDKWYDGLATFLIKKQDKNKKEIIDFSKVKLNKPKKQAYVDENVTLMKERILILRKNSTYAEKLLKKSLNTVFGDGSFIFQKGFFFKKHNFFYITDFYSFKYNLVIEVDGNYHKNMDQKEKDLQREETLEKAYRVSILRFTNEQIITNIENIIKTIRNEINSYNSKKDIKNKEVQCKFCKAICKNAEKLKKHYINSHKNFK